MQKNKRQSVSQRMALDRPRVLFSRLTRVVAPVLVAAVVAGAFSVQASTQPAEKTAEIPLRQAAAPTAEQKAEQPQYRYALSDKVSLSDTDAAERMLFQANSEVKENATGLYINGKFIGALRNAQTLQNLLDSLLNSAKNNAQADSASFVDDIQLVSGQYARSSIVTLNAMCSLLQGNRTQPRTYTIADGDTLERIAQKNAVSTAQLTQANPDLKFDSLHAGDVIQLEPSQKVLSIRTQRTSTETSAVPYQKVTQETADLYVGETKVQAGAAGSKTTTYRVTKVDGMLMKKEAVAAQQTKAPVNEVTLVGVRPRPDQQGAAGIATGTFIWPTPTLSTITSGYEARWGTFHYGLDISGANAAGQPIVAADGGTVAFAGSDDSGYGTYVIIDHGNGYRSYYGHMTKALIQTGEKVAQGQLIGLVGSTGDSTGPHCHFEVRKGDDRIDPTKLVNVDRNVVTPYVGQTLETEAATVLATEAKKQSDQSIADYQKAAQLADQKNAEAQQEAAAKKDAEETDKAKQAADQEATKEAAEKASEEEVTQQADKQAAEQPAEETSKKEEATQPIPVQTS